MRGQTMHEPVVGNPEQMAAAIARALDLTDEWERIQRKHPFIDRDDLFYINDAARGIMREIRDALENYTED